MQIWDQVSNSFRSESDRTEIEKPRVGQSLLARADFGAIEVVEVDDAEMHAPDGRGIVIDQSHAADPAGARDSDLFLEFSPHRGLVGVERPAPCASSSDTCPPTPSDRSRCNRASPWLLPRV